MMMIMGTCIVGLTLILLSQLVSPTLASSSSSSSSSSSFASSDDKCKFPREWKGRWYQSGLGEVSIRQSTMGTKGVCKEHQRDYFLLYNRERKCYQCLLMMKRHKNIIQYKESFCTPESGELKVVCDSITVEATLYTLVRDPYSTIRCPFQEAYYFNYNDNFAGFCNNPISYVTPCVGGQRFRFHFKHCSMLADMNGQELDFECVATWKEGSDTYLYGKFSGPTAQTKAEGYRCFKFESYGPDIWMSMSADATCRGLNSPKDGPLVMEFSKNTYGWLEPACQFPTWLASTTWRDLEGKRTYALDSSGDTLVGYYRRKPSSKSFLKSELRCIQHQDVSDDDDQYTMMGFATYDCTSKHQCIKVVRRGPGVVELYQGILSDTIQPDSCMYNREYTTVRLLIGEHHRPVSCPEIGLYFVDTGDGCLHTIDVGCKTSSLIELSPVCPTEESLQLHCVASWVEDDKTYVIAGNATSDDVLNCFSFSSRDESRVTFSSDTECNKAVPELYDSFSYRLTSYPGKCTGMPSRKNPRRKPHTVQTTATETSPRPVTWSTPGDSPWQQPAVTWSKSSNDIRKTSGSNEAGPKGPKGPKGPNRNRNRNDNRNKENISSQESSENVWDTWNSYRHRTSTQAPPGGRHGTQNILPPNPNGAPSSSRFFPYSSITLTLSLSVLTVHCVVTGRIVTSPCGDT